MPTVGGSAELRFEELLSESPSALLDQLRAGGDESHLTADAVRLMMMLSVLMMTKFPDSASEVDIEQLLQRAEVEAPYVSAAYRDQGVALITGVVNGERISEATSSEGVLALLVALSRQLLKDLQPTREELQALERQVDEIFQKQLSGLQMLLPSLRPGSGLAGPRTAAGRMLLALARRDYDGFRYWRQRMRSDAVEAERLFEVAYFAFHEIARMRFERRPRAEIAQLISAVERRVWGTLPLSEEHAQALTRSTLGERGLVDDLDAGDVVATAMQMFVHIAEDLQLPPEAMSEIIRTVEEERLAEPGRA